MKNYLLLLVLSLWVAGAYSQAVAWELSAQPGDQASSAAPTLGANFNNCVLSRGAGLTATTGVGSMNASGWFSGSAATTLSDAIANNDYYEFTVNAINCFFFNPTTIKIVLRSSATGPGIATLRCSSDGFSADIGTVTVATTSTVHTFSETVSPNSPSVTYRLYGYGGAAGGGTPSSGGTMRIGTSVVAADNDLEVFATTTLLQVTDVPNITVNDGGFVPATALTANVPGATLNWARTPESIGLSLTSGTGNVPAFTATNNTGSAITSTFTATATVGSCTSANQNFTITVNPPACSISANFSGSPGACNDNGTPNDPSDDFFLSNVFASFFNRPLTGSLQLVPGGDQIGTYSVPVVQIVGNQFIFQNVMFRADGTPTNVQVNFTDLPSCIATVTGSLNVPSCSNAPACTISGSFSGSPGACNDNGTPNDPSDDFFLQNVFASFFNRPLTGSLQLVPGGDQIGTYSVPVTQIIGNSFIFTNVMFRADGTPTNVQVNFTDLPSCITTVTGSLAVQPCSSAPACSITNIGAANQGPCNNNGTPNDPTDDFFTLDVTVSFANPPATGTLDLSGSDVLSGGGALSVPVANLSGGSHTFLGIRYRADGQGTALVTRFSALPGCTLAVGTSITSGPCSFAAPVLSCPAAVTVSCAAQAPAVNPASVSETHACPGTLTVVHLGDAITNQSCSNRLTITRTYQGSDQCGQTATCSQRITVNDQTPPAFSCPANVTVACASQVAAANPAGISASDNCGGTVTTIHVGDVTTNQTCTNRFTLTRTYRSTDGCGNSATCSQVITVNDQSPPTATCPVNVAVPCANQLPAVNPAGVSGADNCGGSLTSTHVGDVISNQTCANRFTLTRTYRNTDACGNSATCSQLITVNDLTAPSLTCPAPQTVSCAELVPAPNPALVTGLSDNCGGTATPSFFSDGVSNQSCTNRFTLTRQYRATDDCGNTASCTQLITVNDQTPPAFTAVPASVTVDCYAVPGVGFQTASDNCSSGATVAYLGEVSVSGICPVYKILTRSWRATDACGNSTTASQVITVTDTNAPQFLVLPKNKVVECGPENAAELQDFLDAFGNAVVQDCAQISYSYGDSPVQSGNAQCGNTFQRNIRFFATDECGNVAFRDASFTVIDQTPPVFSAPPQNLKMECDAADDNGEAAFYEWLDNNAYLSVGDNCGEVALEKLLVWETSGCGNTWAKTYEFRATDECGNLAKTTATFAVVDNTPPKFLCPPNSQTYLPCIEDLPLADPTALSADDCSGVTVTLNDTWTDGTGCPNWPMTVAYRYAATDGCGNQAVCEQAFYVEETETPVLLCPDTITLACVDDIPGPLQLFGQIRQLLAGNCAGGFTSINILSDSGKPQNGATYRSYGFTAKNHCGLVTSACSVTFRATGNCNTFCTAAQGSWGDPNGTVGGMSTVDAIEQLIQVYGPPKAGGGGHTVSAPDAACVQELLMGSGPNGFIPTGHHTCPLPAALSNADGSLNNQLAANVLALQLNLWYNLKFNGRNLGVQDLHELSPCLVDFHLLKNLGQHSSVQDLLDMANLYLQGVSYFEPEIPDLLNAAIDNLNFFRTDCGLNGPCDKPARERVRPAAMLYGWQLTPNPAVETTRLTFWSEEDNQAALTITGASGIVAGQHGSVTKGFNSMEISLGHLPSGMYTLLLRVGGEQAVLRLAKVED